MLTWALIGETFRGSSLISQVSGSWSQRFAIVESPSTEEIEFRYLNQWGHVPGLDWNGVEHWHADGSLILDMGRTGATRVYSALSQSPPQNLGTVVDTGYYGVDGSSTLFVPVGTTGHLVRQVTSSVWVVLFVDSFRRPDGKVSVAAAFMNVSYRRNAHPQEGKPRNMYIVNASSSFGYKPPYAFHWADSLEEACGTWIPDWGKSSVRTVQLNRSYTNRTRPEMVPTRQQITSLLAHELSQVVGSALKAKYDAIEELHANAFDSIMKFDGNMLLLLSKFNSIGKTTIQSMLDWAGSDMGLKDAASLWLSSRYGDRLSMSGLESLVKSIDREFLTIKTHTTRYVQGSNRLSLSISDEDRGVIADGYLSTRIALRPKDYNAAMRIIRNAYEWDWYPSLGNTWDAVPLSFVVDWFVNVGDIYKSIDRIVAARYYDVVAVLNTVKVIAHTTRCPEVEFTYYDREISKSLQLSVDSVKLGLPSIINWVNGAALFVGLS